MRILTLCLLLIACTAQGQVPVPSTGTIRHFDAFPSRFVDARNIDVWLPDGYAPTKSYAVLYMQDGQMLFDSSITWNKQEWGVDETLGRLLAEGKIRDCIVVGIWNNGPKRRQEYMPQKALDYMKPAVREAVLKVNAPNSTVPIWGEGPISDRYLRFLVEELKPFVDSAFSTLKTPENTFVAGSSMGGLISLYALCEYPDVFGGAACLSTHWVGIFQEKNNPVPKALQDYLKARLPRPQGHRLYFDHGTATLDALYGPHQKKVDRIVKRKGYRAEHWETRVFEGDDHSERAWRGRFSGPVLFLLGK